MSGEIVSSEQPAVVVLPKEDVDRVRRYLRANAAKNTIRAYAMHWENFEKFCAERNVAPLSTDPVLVCSFLTWLHSEAREGGYSWSYIEQARSAIHKAHEIARASRREMRESVPDPTRHESVRLVMESIGREIDHTEHAKAALTIPQIRQLIATLKDQTDIRSLRDRAMLLMGFFIGLRRSEIVSIRVQDLTFSEKGVLVQLWKTKTDQKGKGVQLPLARKSDLSICPVHALQEWLRTAGIYDGPVFRGIHRHGKLLDEPLNAGYFVERLKQAAREAGLPASAIAGHSLRSGFVTAAVSQGVSLIDVANTTRHKSLDMLKGYYRKADVWENPATRLGDAPVA